MINTVINEFVAHCVKCLFSSASTADFADKSLNLGDFFNQVSE